MEKKDLSILLCGKLNTNSLNQLEYYKTIASCVISCWDNDDLSLLDKYNLDSVRVVINNHNVPEHAGPSSIYYQTKTCQAALEKVRTKFAIKSRGDQSFTNLEPMIKLMEENPTKIVSGSPHFSRSIPYHAGDHFYGARTIVMRPALTILKRALEAKLPEGCLFNHTDRNRYHTITQIEQFITRALLYVNGENYFPTEHWKEIMKRNYEVCVIDTLGDVHYHENMGGTRFFKAGQNMRSCCFEIGDVRDL